MTKLSKRNGATAYGTRIIQSTVFFRKLLLNHFFLLQNKLYLRNERQTVITFGKSYSVMESIKSSCESQYLNVLNDEIEKERMYMVFASGNIIQGIL